MKDNFESISLRLTIAVKAAIDAGYVVTVYQEPLHPLEMGHYVHRIDIRPRRVDGTYPAPMPELPPR